MEWNVAREETDPRFDSEHLSAIPTIHLNWSVRAAAIRIRSHKWSRGYLEFIINPAWIRLAFLRWLLSCILSPDHTNKPGRKIKTALRSSHVDMPTLHPASSDLPHTFYSIITTVRANWIVSQNVNHKSPLPTRARIRHRRTYTILE